jgi:hypothetical protein
VTTQRLTKMPTGCSQCADGAHADHLLHLHARCHMHAPMRVSYERTSRDRGVLAVQCYIPDCARPVATFGVREIVQPAASERARSAHDCDLCGDNDPRKFRVTAVDAHHHFTAPFQLELHKAADGQRMLHLICYVEECRRLFAVLALHDDREHA